MYKKTLLFLITVMFIFGISKISYAMMHGEDTGYSAHMQITQADSSEHTSMVNSESASQKTVNVGNKICPVTGEKIDEKTKATYEYKGKIYNFCCTMCIDAFKKDPQRYIKKVEEELQVKAENRVGQ